MLLDTLLAPFAAFADMRELGGPVVFWIFTACIVLWILVLERYWYFLKVLPREAASAQQAWQSRENRSSWQSQQIRKAIISRLNAGMTANLQLLKVLVPMCPLLGLLGTVSGMLAVFDSMAALGSADARSMASGVSEAMVCTLSGLVVSITGLYPAYYFPRRAHRETRLLADRLAY